MRNITPVQSEDNRARLVIGGEEIDTRRREARRYRAILKELAVQLGRDPSPSERLLLQNAATLSLLCERDTRRMITGELQEEEPFRRNVAALRGVLIGLGLAQKSRDVTKGQTRQRGSSILGEIMESGDENGG